MTPRIQGDSKKHQEKILLKTHYTSLIGGCYKHCPEVSRTEDELRRLRILAALAAEKLPDSDPLAQEIREYLESI